MFKVREDNFLTGCVVVSYLTRCVVVSHDHQLALPVLVVVLHRNLHRDRLLQLGVGLRGYADCVRGSDDADEAITATAFVEFRYLV